VERSLDLKESNDLELARALRDQRLRRASGPPLAGYDPLVQAVGGLMSVAGPPETPSKAGVAIVDVVTALYATVAVLAALVARTQSGRGQRVTIDLLHANLAMLANQSAGWLANGESPGRLGNTHPSIEPFATYRAADGDLMILAGNDGQFARLADRLGFDTVVDTGGVRTVAFPAQLSETPAVAVRRPPELDEHEIRSLLRRG
jgi:crotonobetainyl-CoA:carnitine CoA-transferase CaiB-like acyl-CoA transferase